MGFKMSNSNIHLRCLLGSLFWIGLCLGCRQEGQVEREIIPGPRFDTLTTKVRVGETLDAICRNLDLADGEFKSLMVQIRERFRFPIHVNQEIQTVFKRGPGEFCLLSFSIDSRSKESRHRLFRTDSATTADSAFFGYQENKLAIKTDTVKVSGTLNGSLSESFFIINEGPSLVEEVARVFAWDIDFYRDPREGDAFKILVEKRFTSEGQFLGYGRMLSAEYVNAGKTFETLLYEGRYYTTDGHSMEKQLMRVPLKFSARISSPFSHSRLHPVLGIRRPHWGVDYAGPPGTSILAAGSGTVVYAKWVGGYGNTIKVRHNSVYTTYYAHLQGYAKGVSAGRRVAQGDVIGYLGSTGLASGPHLDYRVELNGHYVDPAKLISKPMEGITKSQVTAFNVHRKWLWSKMVGDTAVHLTQRVSSDSIRSGT